MPKNLTIYKKSGTNLCHHVLSALSWKFVLALCFLTNPTIQPCWNKFAGYKSYTRAMKTSTSILFGTVILSGSIFNQQKTPAHRSGAKQERKSVCRKPRIGVHSIYHFIAWLPVVLHLFSKLFFLDKKVIMQICDGLTPKLLHHFLAFQLIDLIQLTKFLFRKN